MSSTTTIETGGDTTAEPLIRRVRDAAELAAAIELRRVVFCEEQGVPRTDELDGRDPEGLHLIALDGDRIIATCRIIFAGSTAQFSRLAVEASERRRRIATRMLERVEREARAARSRRIVLHAQTYALPLYEAAGFRTRGTTFRDAGIEHIAMEKRLA